MQNLDPKSKSTESQNSYSSIRLTETVKKGGCAAKLPAGELRDILGKLSLFKPDSLLVGIEHMDDASLWDLGNGQSLIQTLDFFTPIVDDPRDFGAIAAANALSDVYAMGGTPKMALSILAFPTQTLPLEILSNLMEGALEKIHESGACLAGGHSIDDDTLKFGLSVTGFVETKKAWTNKGASIGDTLILTKALGTGTLTTALKLKEARPEWVNSATESMKQLNKVPELLKEYPELCDAVHGATDITGFGLAGHALQMARASRVNFEIKISDLPVLNGAKETLEQEFLNRAHFSNWDYVKNAVKFNHETLVAKWISVDPQTSGGLLLSVAPEAASKIVEVLKPVFGHTCAIGRVSSASSLGSGSDSNSTLDPRVTFI